MEAVAALSSSAAATLLQYTTPKFSSKPSSSSQTTSNTLLKLPLTASAINPSKKFNSNFTTSILFHPISCIISSSARTNTNAASSAPSTTTTTTTTISSSTDRRHWIVVVKPPPQPSISRPEAVNYYVKTLQKFLGSEEDAQMCIYDASTDIHFGFCCDIDEEVSWELACLPEVLSVRPDPDFNSLKKDYNLSEVQAHLSTSYNGGPPLFPGGISKHWLVRVEPPIIGVITKAQVVDYFAQILTNVLRNEKDAQMCIYHTSWQSNYGFCCELDDECAKELADVPGVLSVHADENVESDNKDYIANANDKYYPDGNLQQSTNATDLLATNQPTVIKTKKLFVTGLSFYTSEKTLRAAFEGFGKLVEVKIIMDKISKRSKGFAFIEYTTEEAASAALKEMNGKIINGWMIVVDVAKTNPPKYSRGRPRPNM